MNFQTPPPLRSKRLSALLILNLPLGTALLLSGCTEPAQTDTKTVSSAAASSASSTNNLDVAPPKSSSLNVSVLKPKQGSLSVDRSYARGAGAAVGRMRLRDSAVMRWLLVRLSMVVAGGWSLSI